MTSQSQRTKQEERDLKPKTWKGRHKEDFLALVGNET